MISIGRNRNSNSHATVTEVVINSVTATTISLANEARISFSVCASPSVIDFNIAIRYYPAADDNTFKGHVLSQFTLGNNNIIQLAHNMCTDNIYTGEISAISDSGTHAIFITEY